VSEARPKAVIKKRFPWGWAVLALLGAGVAVMGVSARNAPVAVSLGAPTVIRAGARNPTVTASGYIVARVRATLSSKVLGRVSWLGVQEGSRVKRGDLLARLESPDLQAARNQVKVQLDQALIDEGRDEQLVKAGALDEATLDRARSQVAGIRAQLAYQDALLESMVLRAPFTGVVTQKLSEVGETVAPGSAGGANAINAILVMADFNTLEVEVEVNETSIAKLRKGMPAEIRVDALDPAVLKGHLREIYPSSDRQKAVVLVRVALEEKNPVLVPDMGAKVTFLGEPYDHDAVILGREQVLKDERGRAYAWVDEGGMAVRKPVYVRAENPIGLEVSGLPADAQLIVAPPEGLRPGARLRVKPA
jgi:RND family efflux transporter MFP subunit